MWGDARSHGWFPLQVMFALNPFWSFSLSCASYVSQIRMAQAAITNLKPETQAGLVTAARELELALMEVQHAAGQ